MNPNERKTSMWNRSFAIVLALALPVTAWAAPRKIEVGVTEKGFGPDKIKVKKGEAVTLAFTRRTDKTCAKQVIVQLGDGQKLEKKLPLNETVEIEATFSKAGELRYACSMDMITGVILVE
jgi:plastocyanin domain-containing protein